MEIRQHVIIIGGGVIGLSIARELFWMGARRITVIDKGQMGREASFAAAGMLTPNAEFEAIDDLHRLCDDSRKLFPQLAEDLRAETGIDIELDQSGTIFAAFTEDDERLLQLRYGRQLTAGIPVGIFSAKETLDAEPEIAGNVRGGLLFQNDWQVENRRLVAALEESASQNGIDLVTQTPIDSLITENGRVIGVVSGDRRYYADITVLATGAWSSLIKLGDEPTPFDVRPIRGQMISFLHPSRLFNRVVYSHRGYLVPRKDGRVLIGATVEDTGFVDQVTAEGVRSLTMAAVEIAPALRGKEIVEAWSGLRPFAADGLPILGTANGISGLVVATAHYRNGILLSPLTARLVAGLILDGTYSEYFDLFGPDRFSAQKAEMSA